MIDPLDEEDARTLIEAIYPEETIRKQALSILAEGIIEANRYGRDQWVIGLGKTVTLTVGHYEICSLWPSRVWLALDNRFLKSNEYYPTLSQLKELGLGA